MYNEIPTNKLALQIWWALTWRAVILAVVGSMLVGFVMGVVGTLVGLEQNVVSAMGGLSGIVIGCIASVYVIKILMIKGFGEYRLTVEKK